ncbi:hypothetical protein BDR04DRAFT_1123442 [Suillus decipiens]|nr:hypothetical protein BDR04DRAFT_1123442 [Suillus decipiens]
MYASVSIGFYQDRTSLGMVRVRRNHRQSVEDEDKYIRFFARQWMEGQLDQTYLPTVFDTSQFDLADYFCCSFTTARAYQNLAGEIRTVTSRFTENSSMDLENYFTRLSTSGGGTMLNALPEQMIF